VSYEADIYRAVQECVPLWSAIGGRFQWDIADSTVAPPYIVAQTVSDDGETTFSGTRGASIPTIQLSCWARSKAQAVEIAKIFRDNLEGYDLPGESKTSLGFDSRTSTFDTDARLFGIILRYRASVQFS
jgi:hypothetical protein